MYEGYIPAFKPVGAMEPSVLRLQSRVLSHGRPSDGYNPCLQLVLRPAHKSCNPLCCRPGEGVEPLYSEAVRVLNAPSQLATQGGGSALALDPQKVGGARHRWASSMDT
jgi:hypothetical protein